MFFFFFSSRRRHTRCLSDWSSDVCSSDLLSMADACDQALSRAGLNAQDVDLLIPHQANIRIIEATAKHAKLPPERVYVNIDRYGNTSAASIPRSEERRVGKEDRRRGEPVA